MIQYYHTSRIFCKRLLSICALLILLGISPRSASAIIPLFGNMHPCAGSTEFYSFLGYHLDVSHCEQVIWSIMLTDKYGKEIGGVLPGEIVSQGIASDGGPYVQIHWNYPVPGYNYAHLCIKFKCDGVWDEFCVPTYGDYPDNKPIEIITPTINSITGPTNLCGDGPFTFCADAVYTTDCYWEIPAGFHVVGSSTGLCITIARDANTPASNTPLTLVAKPHNSDCNNWGPTITKTITAPPEITLTPVRGCDGHCKLLATVNGGVPPFTWNVVAGSNTVPIGNDGRQVLYTNVPCEGYLDIQSLDANGCVATKSITLSSSLATMNESILYLRNTTVSIGDCIGTTGKRPITVNSSYGSLSGATFDIWDANYYDSHANGNGWIDETLYPAQYHGNPVNLSQGTYYIRITIGSCVYWQKVVVPECNIIKPVGDPHDFYVTANPNPNNGYFTANVTHINYEPVAVEVRNQMGNVVYSYNAGTQLAGITVINVDISSQPIGTYTVTGVVNGVPSTGIQVVKQ